MINVRPGATFAALLVMAPEGLVGTLTAGIELASDGSTYTAQSAAGIVEVEPGIYAATRAAPTVVGEYEVVWENGNVRTAEELHVAFAQGQAGTGYRASADEVGALLRARTKGGPEGMTEMGTFDSTTRPTAEDVDTLVEGVVNELETRFLGAVPEALWDKARRWVALRTAQLVELSYFPEQGEDTASQAAAYRVQATDQLNALVNAANMSELFSETEAT